MSGDRPGGPAEEDRLRLVPRALARTEPGDWLVRFAFGAGVSGLAGVMSTAGGPRLGGLFLAFPAVIIASMTLMARREGLRQARADAHGAIYGTLGMIAFAVCAVFLIGRLPAWAALVAAAAVWVVVGLGSYLVSRPVGRRLKRLRNI
ncbi:hypothetical protein Pth03_78690 [Planotetraspora thailandica]|uniref:DUF3147 domain-containing protein n=1 Tax=Planotetraspora thailandica TaxID=487172 RepID=A0A8J3Y242_9ACTN|nr:DUF3147 family protein [Planotetraspora thailandica]GII59480.1 hypothetical protein Pth03_78690 [Planotetraspora thailandica]